MEKASGSRLGAFVLDTGSGESFGCRTNERFCHCSTYKMSLAALVLRNCDAGLLDPQERLRLDQTDIVGHSPVIRQNLQRGNLSVLALAEAAQVESDNGAANILLRRLGGPAALTDFWREIGDHTSRLDAYEPDVNAIPRGTDQNSTTPRAMAETVRRIVLGDVLGHASRESLRAWMTATKSGLNRIRGGLALGWHGLDKTGTGMQPGGGNKTNDVAALFPPDGRGPLIVTGYVERSVFSDTVRPQDEALLRSLGKMAVEWRSACSAYRGL